MLRCSTFDNSDTYNSIRTDTLCFQTVVTNILLRARCLFARKLCQCGSFQLISVFTLPSSPLCRQRDTSVMSHFSALPLPKYQHQHPSCLTGISKSVCKKILSVAPEKYISLLFRQRASRLKASVSFLISFFFYIHIFLIYFIKKSIS